MGEPVKIDWSKLFGSREKIRDRYRSIWRVPLVKRRHYLYKQFLKDGCRFLDVGAGSRSASRDFDRIGMQVIYKSMDVDKGVQHDYYDLEQVDQKFDALLLSEVIEHLTLPEGFELLTRCNGILEKQGIIFVSTPNIYHPNKFLSTADHKTPYAFDELAGLLALAGFEVKGLYRVYNDALHRYIMKVYLFEFLFRFLSMDYAPSIIIVAEKKGIQASP